MSSVATATARYRWVVLGVGTAAQASTAAYFLGLASVTPALRSHFGLDLSGVGALIGVISVGLVLTLVLWGRATDRYGERGVMATGLAGAAACLAAAATTHGAVAAGAALLGAGALGASVNAASGRAVLSWFAYRQRGLAMSVRQTSVPLGAAAAAVALPAVATDSGVPAVFVALAAGCAAAAVAVAVWVREPPGRTRGGAEDPAPVGHWLDARLRRLCLASGLLVVPQFVASAFLVELLHTHRGMPLGLAGALLAVAQLLGAVGRLATGVWSDRVASRIGPLRIVALAITVGFVGCAALDAAPVPWQAAVLLPSAALAICWNGLAFTAAGEMAPPRRTGTALAVQNTANYVSAALTPPLAGLVAEHVSWPAALLLGALAAGAARLALPRSVPMTQLDLSREATSDQNSRNR